MKYSYGFRRLELIFIAGVIVVTLAGAVVFFYFKDILEWFIQPQSLKELAERGEAYIIWHSFFDMMAWALVALAFVLQLREARGRDEQFVKQIEAQRMQSVFFPYLALFNGYIEKFPVSFERLRQSLEAHNGSSHLPPVVLTHLHELQHYHRHLRVLLELIRSSAIRKDEKNDYLRVVHAQLSEDQLNIIRKCGEFDLGKDLKGVVGGLKEQGLNVDFLIGDTDRVRF